VTTSGWLKVIGFLVVIILLLLAWYHFFGSRPEKPSNPPIPTSGEVTPTVTKPVVHGDPILPQPDQHISGVLHITIPPDTTRGKNAEPAKPQEIYIYLPIGPQEPPEVRSDAPVAVTYSPVVDPWLTLDPRLNVGGSASLDGYVSPWAGVRVIQLWSKLHFGLGIDRSAIGVYGGFTFFRQFSVGAMHYTVPLRSDASRFGIIVVYEF
jgi:hypothetical protein